MMMYLEESPSKPRGTGNVCCLVPPTRVYTLMNFRYKAREEGGDHVSHTPDDLFASFFLHGILVTSTGCMAIETGVDV